MFSESILNTKYWNLEFNPNNRALPPVCRQMKKQERVMLMSNKFLRVELVRSFDVTGQNYVEDNSLRVSMDLLQKGIIRQIGANEFVVLMAIASFCDSECESFPSQRKIAEVTGYSLPTVNKIVNNLLEIKMNGVPLLTRSFEQSNSKKKFSIYSLNTHQEVEKEEELKDIFQKEKPEEVEKVAVEVKEQKPKKKTAKDYAVYFKTLYEEEFGINYMINFSKDTVMIKSKLIKEFSEEEILSIFEYVIKNYKTKWANTRFPYPTIGQICSWLGNTALQCMKQELKHEEELDELRETVKLYEEEDYSTFDRI